MDCSCSSRCLAPSWHEGKPRPACLSRQGVPLLNALPLQLVFARKVQQAATAKLAFRDCRSAALGRELEPWQTAKLQRAYETGKRNIVIRDLARQTNLDRKEVLDWLRDFGEKPEVLRQSLQETRQAYETASAERKAVLQEAARVKAAQTAGGSLPSSAPFAVRQRLGGDFEKKRMKKSVVMTLEKVYDTNKYPSDELVDGIIELHPMPRAKVLEWFDAKRKEQRRQSRPLTE